MIQILIQYIPYKRGFVTLNKAVINYLPRYTYVLYSDSLANTAQAQQKKYYKTLYEKEKKTEKLVISNKIV